jgi:sugar phosphate isomerase/epimerase
LQIGFSFFWQVILKLRDPNRPEIVQLAVPDIDNTLNRFAELGIGSIELKLTENTDFPKLFEAIRKLIHKNFHVTFHAPGRFHYPADLNRQLESFAAISKFMNDVFDLIPLWVIHPLNSRIQRRSKTLAQTVDYLRQILNSMAAIPARFALEILRNRAESGKIHVGDSYQDILNILSNFDHENLGICWDFGHSNAMYQRGLQDQFPPPEFLKKVIHCHVHDCLDQKTHLPLGKGEVPIEKNIHLLLQNKFEGILNLEVAPHRMDDPSRFLDYVQQSVQIIRNYIG